MRCARRLALGEVQRRGVIARAAAAPFAPRQTLRCAVAGEKADRNGALNGQTGRNGEGKASGRFVCAAKRPALRLSRRVGRCTVRLLQTMRKLGAAHKKRAGFANQIIAIDGKTRYTDFN